MRRGRRWWRGERGFTLPLTILLVASAVALASTASFLVVQFRTVADTEDGERAYYALDAAVEEVFADLVRGADITDASYTPPTVSINSVTTTATTTDPGAVATPVPSQQYFDPGVTNPDFKNMSDGDVYILHILNVYQTSTLQVGWNFTVSEGGQADGVRIRIFNDKSGLTPGLGSSCPAGNILEQANRGFSPGGTYDVSTAPLDVTPLGGGTYTVAFCLSGLSGTFTTNAHQPTGGLDATWIYAIAFKDYLITAEAEGATVTTYVRQVPGPTQPPGGDWSESNISFVTNQVTPYYWDR